MLTKLILINHLNKFCIIIKYQLKIIYVYIKITYIKLRRESVQ